MNIEELVNIMKAEIVRSVQEIVRIRSVEEAPEPGAPFGAGVNSALLYALNLASSMGFKTKNIDGYMGFAEYGEGNETIGILGHLDVVPEGSGWLFPPYEGHIHDNKIFGRGTVDDKGPIIAALYGLKAIKDASLPLTKKVRILFGTDEESGWLDVDHYLKVDQPPDSGFTPDGIFPVINAEKGAINIEFKKDIIRKSKGMISIKSLKGGEAINIVPSLCSCELRLKDMAKLMLKDTLELYCESNKINMSIQEIDGTDVITSRGLSSHSSTPQKGKNAISQLIIFLSQFNLGQNDVADYIKFLAKYVSAGSDGRPMNINYSDEASGDLTINLSQIAIDEEKAVALVNIRYPVTANFEDIQENILKVANEKKIDVSILRHKKPLFMDKNSEVITKLMKAYSDVTGTDAYTIAIGGQTYAKAFKNMAAFGPIFPGQDECAHMPNEYIGIDDLIKCTRIYSKAIYELAK